MYIPYYHLDDCFYTSVTIITQKVKVTYEIINFLKIKLIATIHLKQNLI